MLEFFATAFLLVFSALVHPTAGFVTVALFGGFCFASGVALIVRDIRNAIAYRRAMRLRELRLARYRRASIIAHTLHAEYIRANNTRVFDALYARACDEMPEQQNATH